MAGKRGTGRYKRPRVTRLNTAVATFWHALTALDMTANKPFCRNEIGQFNCR